MYSVDACRPSVSYINAFWLAIHCSLVYQLDKYDIGKRKPGPNYLIGDKRSMNG